MKLSAVGLRPIPIDDEPSKASGIRGQANTLFMAMVPTILGGAPGIVKVTVVQEDIPNFLSIGLLEAAGSVIDTKENLIHFRALHQRSNDAAQIWAPNSGCGQMVW